MILAVQDMQGESVVDGYHGSIDVLAYSWGAARSADTDPMPGKTLFQNLSIIKWTDSSSPRLLRACAKGLCIPTVTLFVKKTGSGNSFNYIQITLKNVFVRNLVTGGSGGEDRLTETVTLDFEQLWTTYTPQLPDGTPTTPVRFSWNAVEQGPAEGREPGVTPATIHEFGVGMMWKNGAPAATLSWEALARQKFRILFTPDIKTAFTLYSEYSAETDGLFSINIPAHTATGFFRVELAP